MDSAVARDPYRREHNFISLIYHDVPDLGPDGGKLRYAQYRIGSERPLADSACLQYSLPEGRTVLQHGIALTNLRGSIS